VRRMRRLWSLLLFLPLLAFAAAPNLVLKDFDGKDRNVREFIGQGKWTVVSVWSADCPICKREIYHMTFFHDEHRNKHATVLGFSIDGYEHRAKAQGFIYDQSLNFPNLIGTPDDAGAIAGTMFIGTPTYYLFSPEGRFVAQRIGPVTQEQMERWIESLAIEGEKAKKPG
jgi:peroxiredoxin